MTDDNTGTKIAERLFTQPDGATMSEIIAATGGPQYNVLKRLKGRGYRFRGVKEGKETRYFAIAPTSQFFQATLTSKGQVTVPKDVRDHLRLRPGQELRFELGPDTSAVVRPVDRSIRDGFGMLGKPPRSLTTEEMDEVIRAAVVDKYRRAVGRKKR